MTYSNISEDKKKEAESITLDMLYKSLENIEKLICEHNKKVQLFRMKIGADCNLFIEEYEGNKSHHYFVISKLRKLYKKKNFIKRILG